MAPKIFRGASPHTPQGDDPLDPILISAPFDGDDLAERLRRRDGVVGCVCAC